MEKSSGISADETEKARESQPLRPRYNDPKGLLPVISSWRSDAKYTDLEIRCKGKVFRVHKAIVCSQVDFFAACADVNFQESRTGVIELEEEPKIVPACLTDLSLEDIR